MKPPTRRTLDRYVECDKPEHDHHQFSPVLILEGCICDIGAWDVMSDSYQKDRTFGCCLWCEHDKACHKKPIKLLTVHIPTGRCAELMSLGRWRSNVY